MADVGEGHPKIGSATNPRLIDDGNSSDLFEVERRARDAADERQREMLIEAMNRAGERAIEREAQEASVPSRLSRLEETLARLERAVRKIAGDEGDHA